MTIIRQPSNVNPQSQTGWKLVLKRAPNLEFFCTEFQPPSVQLGTTKQYTPLEDIPWGGDRLYRTPVSFRFMVSEDWTNYDEIYNWMVGLARPELSSQYATLARDSNFKLPQYALSGTGVKSDITCHVTTSKRNPSTRWVFLDAFPVSLVVPRFSFQDTQVQYLQADVNFVFRHFHLDRPGE